MVKKYTDESLADYRAVDIYKMRLSGTVGRFPIAYWQQEDAKENAAFITRYFIEEVMQWGDNDIREKATEKIFREYHLSGMLQFVFNRSVFKAIDNAYPGRFKAWEFGRVPKFFWEDRKNIEDAISYLLEKTGKKTSDELTEEDYNKYKFMGLAWYMQRRKIYTFVEKEDAGLDVVFPENGESATLEIPVHLLEEAGITKDSPTVKITVREGSIVIEQRKD